MRTVLKSLSSPSTPDDSPAVSIPYRHEIKWTIHKAREMPGRLALVVIGYALSLVAWWYFLPVVGGLILPVLALTSAMAEFLFPVTYVVDEQGVTQTCFPFVSKRLDWTQIRRASVGRDGIFVTTLGLPSRLDQFRGIRLETRNQHDAVRQYVKQQMDALRSGVS